MLLPGLFAGLRLHRRALRLEHARRDAVLHTNVRVLPSFLGDLALVVVLPYLVGRKSLRRISLSFAQVAECVLPWVVAEGAPASHFPASPVNYFL